MTIEQLWDEYRAMVCPPDLEEPGGSLFWQETAFKSGVMATIGSIAERPACFHELRASVAEWLATRQVANAADDEREPMYQVALTFMRRPFVSCFGLPGLMDVMRAVEPGLYTVSDMRGREVAVALRKTDGDWLVEFEDGTTAGTGFIIV